MKIQTLSIVAGSKVCNASCPFCVSRMTGLTLGSKEPDVNWRNFRKACRLAQINNVSTVLITGKGEPTLFPKQITQFMEGLSHYHFPFIELQTNGLMLTNGHVSDADLDVWHTYGMTTIALSLVHWEQSENQKVYQFANTEHYDVAKLVKNLQDRGFSIRLTVMLLEGFVDSINKLEKLIRYAKEHNVQQLTIRPIRQPTNTSDPEASEWVTKHALPLDKERMLISYIADTSQLLLTLPHGARIYDHNGQNICLSDCLTIQPDSNEVRQLIFFPDGSLRYDWQYAGAVLI